MYKPDFDQFKDLLNKGNLVPVYKEILGDMETPLSILRKLDADQKNTFLMESVEKNERIGRYSFIGNKPRCVVRVKSNEVIVDENGLSYSINITGDPFIELKKIMNQYNPVIIPELPIFCGGAIGYLGYGMVRFFENIPQKNFDDLCIDESYFMITDTLVIFDHVKNKIIVMSNAHVNDINEAEQAYKKAISDIDNIILKLSQKISFAPCEFIESSEQKSMESNITKVEFEQSVIKAKEYIKAGDIFQVVLSQRFSSSTTASPLNIYRALRSINPSPYMYYLNLDGFQVIGSSPEIMVRCIDKVAEIRPIAGTRQRGKDCSEDAELAKDLLADPKEIAEHVMLLDLGRNDLGRVCEFNTVAVDNNECMIIEYYSHVMHIVSDVKGKLKDGADIFDVVKASFPAGTVSGAPKIRAMQIIEELEKLKRGPYAGAVGYFSFNGNLDTAITIRTIVLKDDKVYIQAGAGIVADSNPESEYYETINKGKGLFKAVALAEKIEKEEI